MSRELLQQALTRLQNNNDEFFTDGKKLCDAIKAELSKPEHNAESIMSTNEEPDFKIYLYNFFIVILLVFGPLAMLAMFHSDPAIPSEIRAAVRQCHGIEKVLSVLDSEISKRRLRSELNNCLKVQKQQDGLVLE